MSKADETRRAIERHYKLGKVEGEIVRIPNHARQSLAALYRQLGFLKGAELGVWNGEHAEMLCQYNPQMTLYCVDAWEQFALRAGHPDPRAFVKVRHQAERRLAPYPQAVIWQQFNDEAARAIPDGSLDCIFVDASHGYADVLNDLKVWSPKVRSGGIVSGHDYETTALGWPPENGVKEAVHAYLDAWGIGPVYLLMGTARDRWKSYFWVQL